MFSKKKALSIALASTLGVTTLIPLQSAKAETITEGTVTAHSLTVRTGPSANYTAKDWLKSGQKVTILKDHGAFSYVQYGNKKGYVHDGYLKVSKREVNSGKIGTVTAHSLTVRTGPSANHSAKDWLKKGDKVQILKDHGAFSYIQYGNKTGYVHDGYLSVSSGTISTPAPAPTTPTPPKPAPVQETSKVGTVTASSLTVRTGPSASYAAQDWLKKGDKVTILKDHGAFSHIQYRNGKTGYVHDGYLSVTGSVSTPAPTPSKPATPAPTNPSKTTVHTVRSGDTLWSISKQYGTTVASIQQLNGLSNTLIKVGQKLNVSGKTSTPVAQQGVLKGKVIVIDPGHGGKYAGAQGIVREETVNLEISLKLRDELQRLGATVIMTRTGDTHLKNTYAADLAARPGVAISHGAHMFISVHANAGGSAASGTETYWMNTNRGDQKLATNIVNNIAQETGLRNRGAKYANFAVLRNSGSNIPSVLIETAFVTNSHDASILGSANGQSKMANAIANGVASYFK